LSARSPAAAVEAFLLPHRRAFSCIVGEHATLRGGFNPKLPVNVLALNNGLPARLYHPDRSAHLIAAIHYKHSPTKTGWCVETAGYILEVVNKDDQRIIGYHWHTNTARSPIMWPHVHVGPADVAPKSFLARAHLATHTVSLPGFVREAIEQLRVTGIRDDWPALLAQAQADIDSMAPRQ
jgi:hypothetical protein